MTAETAKEMIKILQSCYPGESYKISGEMGRRMAGLMEAMLRRVPDEIVVKAVGRCCENYEMLPSLSSIRKATREISNAVPDFVALAAPTTPLNKEKLDVIIQEAIAKREQRKKDIAEPIDPNDAAYYSNLPRPLIEFARRKFPDISLKLIDRNRSEFDFVREQGGKLDGLPLAMRMETRTGNIYTIVVLSHRNIG